jgi:hypothetical protein
VHEGNRHTALTHGGSNAFDGTQSHIAARLDAGDACFEEMRMAAICSASGLYDVITR